MVTAMASVKLVSGQNYHNCHNYPYYHQPLGKTDQPLQIMTLEDSLPQRSTSTDYDPGSDSTRDMSSPLSPEGSESRDFLGTSETPTKKNKRKLSEPKKRAELCTAKRLRESSPAKKHEGISNKRSRHGKELANGHCKGSPLCTSATKYNSNGVNRDTSSSSSSLSINDTDCNKDTPLVSLTNVMTPHFLSPMFTGVHPSSFGYVPGIYLAGQPFSHQGVHASFPSIPINLHHNYITATAVSSSSAATTTDTSPLFSVTLPAHVGSKSQTAASEICQRDQLALRDQTTSQAIVNPLVPSPISSSHPPPSPYSVLHIQPSSRHHPGLSRTITASNNDDDDDEDELSSRAASPEDLSVGGKLSRKHRKNYKNMTRERRVEANARERTRVHTISAAFDALRRAVPSYSHNQKLSKLAILRIASSYILALARLNDQDYTSASDHVGKPLTFAECVDMCTSTIQTEGRARRRH